MQRGSLLSRVSDLSHFRRHQQLVQVLPGARLLRWSPDLKHLCVYLSPERTLITFEGHRVAGQAARPLDKHFGQSEEELLDILLVDIPIPHHPQTQSDPHRGSVATLVTPRGRAEVWQEAGGGVGHGGGRGGGWQPVQSVELCNGPRARVVSVAGDGRSVTWCEERPPSGVQPAHSKNLHQYCVCRRYLEVVGGADGGEDQARVRLGAISIILHNSPAVRVVSCRDLVYLVLTDSFCSSSNAGSNNLNRCLLIWSPVNQTLTVTSPTRGPLASKTLLPGDSDFRKLMVDVAGVLASLPSPDLHTVSACSSLGGLLLATAGGDVTWVRGNGAVSRICSLGQRLEPGTQVLLEAHQGTLACALGRTLHLFDTATGRRMEKVLLNADPLALATPQQPEGSIQLLTKDGVYLVAPPSSSSSSSEPVSSYWESGRLEEVLEHMVLEEACRYYQRRSLSSSRLTVEKLKRGGMFQAPIALCSILQRQLKMRNAQTLKPETLARLSGIMADEVQSYVALEKIKSCVVHAPESKVPQYGEGLVEEEIGRLLHIDLDGDNLSYLNSIFTSFPSKAWEAVKETWNLHQNAEGQLSARATADMWRLAVGPGPPANADPQGTSSKASPVFELICCSLYRFQPKWLPQFVELAQEQQNRVGGGGGGSHSHSPSRASRGGNKDSAGNTNAPLYKRALSVLPSSSSPQRLTGEPTNTQVAILLSSQRPNAVLQAVRILVDLGQWPRVLEVARTCSRQSPLLRKELFASLLLEFSRHRALDAFAEQLWDLCPPDTKAADILSSVLREVIEPATESGPYPSRPAVGVGGCVGGSLTVGLLRPLLTRVLEWEAQHTDTGLNSLIFPPPTPPRHKTIMDSPQGWTLESPLSEG